MKQESARKGIVPNQCSRFGNCIDHLPEDVEAQDRALGHLCEIIYRTHGAESHFTTLGLVPRATVEEPGGERRLDRTIELIKRCRYSVHELSPISGGTLRPRPPRLNMAFELGVVVGLAQAKPRAHTWFLFADRRAQLDRSLSDLEGTDAYFHGRRVFGVFRELGNAFVRSRRQPTVQEMVQVYERLEQGLPQLKRRTGSRSPFKARVFSDLRVLARALTSRLTNRG